MKRFGFTVVKNATANVIRGGATAVVALALPHFLTRALNTDRFAAWSLMLQIAAYASYLDFGLQTAVARFLAQAMELGQEERRDHLVSTALIMLSVAGAVALGIIALVLWQLPHLFHGVPPALLSEFRSAAFLLAVASCASLPLSTFTGVLIGLHKNEYPALAVGGSRMAGAVLVIAAAHYTHSLVVLAACLALTNLAGGITQIGIAKRILPRMRVKLTMAQHAMANELMRYCLGLTVWSLGMFLVSGLDVTIVGHFQFAAVGYYAIASTLINFIAGLNNAVFSALMTPFAALHAKGNVTVIGRIVMAGTQLNTYGNVLISLLLALFGFKLLTFWVGPVYAREGMPILLVLAVAQAVRLIGSAYAMMLVATGQQNKGIPQGVVEALTNFGFSIGLAVVLGPIGVAWGTLIGAVCGVTWSIAVTMRWTWNEVPIPRGEFMRRGILGPVLVAVPLVPCLFFYQSRGWTFLASTAVGVTVSLLIARRAGYLSTSWRSTADF
jgi:O-antigen/teichoic acid export membrane protein